MATITITTTTRVDGKTIDASSVQHPVKNKAEGEAFVYGYITAAFDSGTVTGGVLARWEDSTLYYGPDLVRTLTYTR